MLDIQLFGLAAGSHHLTNLVFHSANTVLLFLVLFQMTRALWRSAFVAGLFAAHPLHVESVAWIAERKDVLSTFFWLLTMWAYCSYVRRPNRSRYLLMVVFFGLGLMAKPMLVTLPFVLLLLDLWPLNRARLEAGQQRVWLRLVAEKLPLFLMAIASSVITIVVQWAGGAVASVETLPIGIRAANAAVSYVSYIVKMLWPARLAVVYPYVLPIPWWAVVGSVLILLCITAVALRFRRFSFVTVGWLWYLGTLAPVIGIIQVGNQPMADRYTYIPLIGLFIVIAWGIPELLKSARLPKIVNPIAGAMAIIACSIAAYSQTQYWQDNLALWGRALAVTSNNARANNNFGNALSDQKRRSEAVAHYKEALRINPRFSDAHYNLGNALAAEGKIDEAIESYKKAISLAPNNPQAYNGLGSALDDQGKYAEAVVQYREAIRLNPTLADVHNNIAVALLKEGKTEDAIKEFSESVRLDPRNADSHYNLGVALVQGGHTNEASQQLETALQLNPSNQAARQALNDLKQGKNPGAGR
jgi:Flp pilus assembly protein TadD